MKSAPVVLITDGDQLILVVIKHNRIFNNKRWKDALYIYIC